MTDIHKTTRRPKITTGAYDAASDPAMSRAINRFSNAVREDAFIGAAHPDEHSEIIAELDAAKANLLRVISRRVNK